MPKNRRLKRIAAGGRIHRWIQYGGTFRTSGEEKAASTTTPICQTNTTADPPAKRPRLLRDFAAGHFRYATIRDQGGRSRTESMPDTAPRPAVPVRQTRAAA